MQQYSVQTEHRPCVLAVQAITWRAVCSTGGAGLHHLGTGFCRHEQRAVPGERTNTQLPGAGSCRSQQGACPCSPRPFISVPQAAIHARWADQLHDCPQVEVLVIMGHLFRRTLVMPDHLTSSMDHLHAFGRQQLADFFDFRDLSTWVPVITMQEYLDVR